jgi:hypothetical protein
MNLLEPSPWLAAARAQSQRLAETRATLAPPLRLRERRVAPVRLRWALALSLVLAALASGAWAWVQHARVRPSPPLRSIEMVPAARVRAIAARTIPAAAQPRAVHVVPARPAIVPPSPPSSGDATGEFIEPDGEVIFVHPRVQQAPLFDAREYKRRGVLVQPGE